MRVKIFSSLNRLTPCKQLSVTELPPTPIHGERFGAGLLRRMPFWRHQTCEGLAELSYVYFFFKMLRENSEEEWKRKKIGKMSVLEWKVNIREYYQ